MKISRTLLLPTLLFLGALFLDHIVTQDGLLHQTGAEGNPVAVLVWRFVHPSFAVFLWGIFFLLTAFLLEISQHSRLSRILLYAGFVGHFYGFLSWTPVLRGALWLVHEALGDWLTLSVLFVGYGVGGYLIDRIHMFVTQSREA